MEIIGEGALDKALEVPGKTLDGEKSASFDEILNDKYFKQSHIDFTK